MSNYSRIAFLSSTLLFVLFFSLAQPMAAFADDGAPPPPATQEPVQPPTSEPEEADAPVTEAAPTEPAALPEEVPAPVQDITGVAPSPEAGTEQSGEATDLAEDITVAEILKVVPDGTEIMVLDENGETLPLASTEAAELVATVDPIWCPNGQNPGNDLDDGVQDCSNAFATPQELIDDMDAVDPRTPGRGLYEWSGTIYFTADPGGAFVLIPGGLDDADAALYEADYNRLKNYSLTLQGGWNGATGAGYGLTGGQTTFTNSSIQIGTSANPWVGNIRINNVTISSDPASTADAGLTVFTDGQIFLDYVDVLGNPNGGGAYLDNDSAGHNVIVRHSNFNGNADTGLEVASNGLVRLVDVSANQNDGSGAIVTANTSTGEVIITGASTFNGNLGDGLSVNAYGDVTLQNVVARDNEFAGAILDNTSGDGSVSIINGRFIHNDTNGLVALSNGDISLTTVIANRNTYDGIYLDNSTGTGTIDISASTFGAGTTTGNGVNGLTATSNGSITLTGVTATGNDMIGALLDSDDRIEVNNSDFNQNGDTGLGVLSNAGITLTNVNANDNSTNGVFLVTPSDVSISNSNFDGNATDLGGGTGLGIFFAGNVTLDTVSASNTLNGPGSQILALTLVIKNSTFNGNSLDGADLAVLGDATIICSEFKGNLGVGVDGLSVAGIFTLNDVTFGGNAGDYLGTPVLTSGACKVAVTNKGNKPPSSSSGLSLQIVPVDGGDQVGLDCSAYSGTKLVLPDGDRVLLPCPIRDVGQLTEISQSGLPGPLGEGFDYLSALEVAILQDGQAVSTLGTSMTIDFVIPESQQDAELAILRWDEEKLQWVEITGLRTGDGRFLASSKYTGVYVLVTK